MLRRLYDWTVSLAQTPWALAALAVIAFLESSVFPIPPDILMIPMIIAAPRRAFLIAGVCTLSSVAGGALGYWIGSAMFETWGIRILEFYHKADAFTVFQERFNAQGHWAVLFAGITPFPYKVITITSGATGLPFAQFMFWSLVARGLRFFVVAALLWKFGEPIRNFVERKLGLFFTLFMLLLIGGFVVARYM